ncbi:hypothetical protein ACHAXR_007197 [Thalassiosira sp. AJA248-18]
MTNKGRERIYIGGLDPSRGLNVELVAARLCSVEGVEVLSINDVATDNNGNKHSNSNDKKKPVYNSKTAIVDDDGDLVDTRNFFFLEARSSSSSTSDASSPSSPLSALDLLAKQYNSVKWKGCQLRVEAATPHILKRLQDERALRLEKIQACNDAAQKHQIQGQEPPEQTKGEKTVVNDRRRLRIRKRFGEEAFHVDTHPRSLEISQQEAAASAEHGGGRGGWDAFASLHKRNHDKRQSQQKKLVERRKKERRLWASGKGTGKKNRDPDVSAEEGLRSLMFLNRGIHIRFSDELDQDDGGDREEVMNEVVEPMKRVVEDDVSATSSSVVSSDSEESSEHHIETNGGSKGYVWSDEDDSGDDGHNSGEDSHSDVSSGENVDAGDEKLKTKGDYAWSDDEDDDGSEDGTSDGQSSDGSEDIEEKYEVREKNNVKGGRWTISGTEYTKAVAIDEFSGGMDFGDAPDIGEEHASDSGDGDDDDDSDSDNVCGYIPEDDILSNLGVLSNLFPGESFDQRPLATSIADGGGDEDVNVGKSTGANELGKRQNSSSLFGAGLIMQRYDPSKDSDKKFEIPQADKNIAEAVPTEEKGEGKDNDGRSSIEDASASGESSDGGNDVSPQHVKQLEGQGGSSPKEKAVPDVDDDVDDKKLKTAINIEGKDAPTEDVYEQGKLEDIFQQARDSKPESFSLANLFQNEEKSPGSADKEEIAEYNVYEQDKLEDVFKQAQGNGSSKTSAGGFTFGFQNQLPPDDKAVEEGSSAPFSFGFDVNNTPKNEDDKNSPQMGSEQAGKDHEAESDEAQTPATVNMTSDEPKKMQLQRKRRVGMIFPDSDLDKYEDMFFSLNEGPQILKDCGLMKQDEENQERWEKERQVLTGDWKRKQKSASSRKVKKIRRL